MFCHVGYWVLAAINLILGAIAGIALHRSDLCFAGAIRDFFLFRDPVRLRAIVLAVGVCAVFFELLRLSGIRSSSTFPLLGPPSLTNFAGGALFGIGMVLAGGCAIGLLYKLGAGSVLAASALAGMVVGAGLYAEIHPGWSVLARATTLAGEAVTLPQWLGVSPAAPLALLFLLILLFLHRAPWENPAEIPGYLQPWRGALVVALVGVASVALVGIPLGVTTAFAKVAAFSESLFIPGHLATLDYFQRDSLHYTPPLLGTVVTGGAAPRLDGIAAIQFPLIAGIIGGSFASALRAGEFRVQYRAPRLQYACALVGGIFMGLAARMAPACNVWHLLGGVPILASQSLLFLAGLLPGSWIGSRILLSVVFAPRRNT